MKVYICEESYCDGPYQFEFVFATEEGAKKWADEGDEINEREHDGQPIIDRIYYAVEVKQ